MDFTSHAIAGHISWVIKLSPFALLPLIWQIYVYCKTDYPSFSEAVQQYKNALTAEALHYHSELPKEFLSEHLDLTHFADTEIAEVNSIDEAKKLITSSPIFSKCPRSLLKQIADGIPKDADDMDYWRCSPEIEYTEHENNASIVIGYKYDLLLQKTVHDKYAFVFVIVGNQFADEEGKSFTKEEKNTKRRSSCSRRKNSEQDVVHEAAERLIKYQFEKLIMHQFEKHIQEVTIPRLQSMDVHPTK